VVVSFATTAQAVDCPTAQQLNGSNGFGQSVAMINDQGGVNGRKINFISYDDAYSPPKTVEMVRKLVEEDQVGIARQGQGEVQAAPLAARQLADLGVP